LKTVVRSIYKNDGGWRRRGGWRRVGGGGWVGEGGWVEEAVDAVEAAVGATLATARGKTVELQLLTFIVYANTKGNCRREPAYLSDA
jgi:hypothetical protein